MRINSGLAFSGYLDKYYKKRADSFYNFLVLEIIRFSKPGNILDVGSGGGFFLELCKKWGLSAMGIEGSEEMIEKMNARYPGLKVIHHLLSDRFPIEDCSFQTVIFNEVIEHLELELQVHCLNEIFRLLVPGGCIIVHSPSKYNLLQKKEDPTHINLLSPKELSILLKNAGFEGMLNINSPLYILGKNRISKKIIDFIFNKTKISRLSSTASFIAYKK